MSEFAGRLIDWQRTSGRHDLPWQIGRDPYRIWVSEIMLQQTQVRTVIPYFERWLGRFPDIDALSAAPLDEVMAAWSGLGYYARARNLWRAARIVKHAHGGRLPRDRRALESLPGIGRSTAAAIASLAWDEPAAILDGNVRRVLSRCFAVAGSPGDRKTEAGLWQLAESLLPESDVATYTQGIMDLGAMVCTRSHPACESCPVRALCAAHRLDRVADFPSPSPRRSVPERALTALILLAGERVLLECRPPAGIWGGLHSVPEAPHPLTAPSAWVRDRFGLESEPISTWDPVTHAFTHFRLTLHPVLLEVSGSNAAADPIDTRWVPIGELGQAGLPAPVRKLLARILPRDARVSSPGHVATSRCE